ncbi:YwpF family protein [Sporosarcina sp. CAU 1771]
MKTFKMLSVSVSHDNQVQDFPLIDGIIINQENSHHMWILEMFIDQKYKETFEGWMHAENPIEVKVVISYPENEPAAFLVAVDAVKQIGNRISVLMKGRLKRARSQYAEQLLEELLGEGLEGQDLQKRFESDMRSRPRLKKDLAITKDVEK